MNPEYEKLFDEKADNMLKILDYQIEGKGDEETVKKLIARNKELDAEMLDITIDECIKVANKWWGYRRYYSIYSQS